MRRNCAVISALYNGLPSLLWGNYCQRVVTIVDHPEPQGFHNFDDKYTLAYGSPGDTRFLYRLLERSPQIDMLVLDSFRYASLISPYYLLGKAISPPGIVIFVGTRIVNEFRNGGVLRFIADLRSGHLDGIRHEIVDVLPQDGIGISYEIIR